MRATKAEIDRMLTAGLDFDDLSGLKSRLAALRADGAPADAEGLAMKAQKLLIAEAEANFDQRRDPDRRRPLQGRDHAARRSQGRATRWPRCSGRAR